MAVLATAAIGNYASVEGTEVDAGPGLAMVAGLVLAAAGVVAMLRV